MHDIQHAERGRVRIPKGVLDIRKSKTKMGICALCTLKKQMVYMNARKIFVYEVGSFIAARPRQVWLLVSRRRYPSTLQRVL
jgi:hypothetical protein